MHKTKDALCKSPSLSYDLYSVLDKRKSLKNTFQAKVEGNSRTFQGLAQTFKDFSRASPKFQGLFKTVPWIMEIHSSQRDAESKQPWRVSIG